MDDKVNTYIRRMNEMYADRSKEFAKPVGKKILNKPVAIISIVIGALLFLVSSFYVFCSMFMIFFWLFIVYVPMLIAFFSVGIFIGIVLCIAGAVVLIRNKVVEQDRINRKKKADELFNEVKERIRAELGADIGCAETDEYALNNFRKFKSASSAVNACLFMSSENIGLREAATVGVGEIKKFMHCV